MIQQEIQTNSSTQENSPIFKAAAATASSGFQFSLGLLQTGNYEVVNLS